MIEDPNRNAARAEPLHVAKVHLLLHVVLLLLVVPEANCVPTQRNNESCETKVITIFTLEQRYNGVNVFITPVVPGDSTGVVVAELDDVVLPQPECGQDLRRCPLECLAESDGGLLCPFPVRNGTRNYLALVYLEHSPSDPGGFRTKKVVLVPPKADCVPLRVFDRGPDYAEELVRYFVPCLDTTSSEPFLYFEHFRSDFANSSSLNDDTWISRSFIRLEDGDVSPLVYMDGTTDSQSRCSPPRNVFLMVTSKVVGLRIHGSYADFSTPDGEIDRCPTAKSFEEFEPGFLRIQCSPSDDIVIYDACGSEDVVERYNTTVNATVYQCPDANLNVHQFKEGITLAPYGSGSMESKVIKLPFSDTVTAQCVGRVFPVLFLTRGSGETYFLDLTTEKLHYLAANTCRSPLSCLELSVHRMRSTVGVFDYTNNTHLTLDLTCPSDPVIYRTHYPNPPSLSTLVSSGNTQPCAPCAQASPNTPPAATDSHTSGEEPSVETPGTSGNRLADSERTVIGLSSGGVVLIVILGAVMITLVTVVSRWRKHSGTLTPSSTTPSATSNDPPEPNHLTLDAPVCAPHEADDPGQETSMVQPSADLKRYTREDVVQVRQDRLGGEDGRNNMDEKVDAMEASRL